MDRCCIDRQQLVLELEIDETEHHNQLKEEYSSLLTENVSAELLASLLVVQCIWKKDQNVFL